jgi:hypothetical protein
MIVAIKCNKEMKKMFCMENGSVGVMKIAVDGSVDYLQVF